MRGAKRNSFPRLNQIRYGFNSVKPLQNIIIFSLLTIYLPCFWRLDNKPTPPINNNPKTVVGSGVEVVAAE